MPDATPEPAAIDLENCRQLLAFLQISFRGATISGHKIDDWAKSLAAVLAFVRLKER